MKVDNIKTMIDIVKYLNAMGDSDQQVFIGRASKLSDYSPELLNYIMSNYNHQTGLINIK